MQMRSTSSRVPAPPVLGGKELDLAAPAVARRFDGPPDPPEFDDAVTWHATVGQQILGRHQPVTDMVREHALRLAGPLELGLELRIPPDVIRVDGHTNAVAQPVAQIERHTQRIDATAVRRVHGMQRLDRQRHPLATGMVEQRRNAIAHAPTRVREDSRDPATRPPTTRTRHSAPSAQASSTARRLSSRFSRSSAVKNPPRQSDETRSPWSPIIRTASGTPRASSWSRQGAMAPMPCRAQPSIASLRPQRSRTVAVFSDRSVRSLERSRSISSSPAPDTAIACAGQPSRGRGGARPTRPDGTLRLDAAASVQFPDRPTSRNGLDARSTRP